MVRVLVVLAFAVGITVGGFASNTSGAALVATLDLAQLPAGTKDASAQLLAFVSDTVIVIDLCPNGAGTRCSLSLLQREGDVLRSYASTSHFRRGRAIHISSRGEILLTPFAANPAMLFTPDLSSAQELPKLFLASQSGDTGADLLRGGWKLYRVKSQPEFIREGKGSLRSLSDDVIVFQDGNMMRIESLQGAPLGSFHVKPETQCYNDAQPLGTDKLYLDDCKKVRIVDFSGKEKIKLHPPSGYRAQQLWSSNGSRILFDNFDRKISLLRNAGEILLAVGTLGAGVADQEDNREEVVVVDTTTGNPCFEWKRRFPEGSVTLPQDAAISPSGEFVAIAASGTLSIYRLPDVCQKRIGK